MMEDVRDKAILTHADVVGLNFIRDAHRYRFRRHPMNGLRSHVMEVLRTEDLKIEYGGAIQDEIRIFPRAMPVKMLRIFRRKFSGMAEINREIARFKTVERYLTPAHVAISEEFVVAYKTAGGSDLLLCGLQQFVRGEDLDPWTVVGRGYLPYLTRSVMARGDGGNDENETILMDRIRSSVADFVERVKKMACEAGLIPDLAGVRNMLVTPAGEIKLVDINNISRISSDGCVPTDDFGYPVCDKSIEALSLIEEKLLEKTVDRTEPIYRFFFDPVRMKEVERLDREFHEKKLTPGASTIEKTKRRRS